MRTLGTIKRMSTQPPRETVRETTAEFYAAIRPLLDAFSRNRPIRTVAAVGNQPLPPRRERAEIIDSADLVFRVNGFRTDAHGGEPTVGERCDVVFFNRGIRPTPWFFEGYPERLYLMVEPGRMHSEREETPPWWPPDLGFVSMPNRDLFVPLGNAMGLDVARTGQWATTGTAMAWFVWNAFPDAEIRYAGFSFVENPDQTSWEHAYGDGCAVGPEHAIRNEAELFRSWLATGRARMLS